MTIQHSARLGLRYPQLSDSADVPRDIEDLVDDLDTRVLVFDAGPLADRPADPGFNGLVWVATDSDGHVWIYQSGWIDVGPGVGISVDAAQNVGSARTLGSGHLQACPGDDARLSDTRVPTNGTVSLVKIAAALRPDQDAGGNDLALRALGTAAGRAATGTHAPQHNPGGSDELDWNAIRIRLALLGILDASDSSSAVGITNHTQDTAHTVMSSDSFHLDSGEKVYVVFSCPDIMLNVGGGGNAVLRVDLWQDGGFVQALGKFRVSGSILQVGATLTSRVLTIASSANHQFTIKAWTTEGGSGTTASVNPDGDTMSLKVLPA